MRKKIMSCALAVTMLTTFFMNGVVLAASAPVINMPNGATVTGFTVKRTTKVNYNCDQPILDPAISSSQVVGYCYSYVGRYRAKEKVDGKYYDALLVKANMEPRAFKGTKGRNYYGYSQYLSFSADLRDHCVFQASSPNNATGGSDSYSVGISGGSDGASLSATVNLESKYCNISDNSSNSDGKFRVSFDYKTNALDWSSSSDRNKMLFGPTWQVATCEWTTTKKQQYNIPLKVKARFGFGSSKNGAGIFGPIDDYISDNTSTWSCCYGTK